MPRLCEALSAEGVRVSLHSVGAEELTRMAGDVQVQTHRGSATTSMLAGSSALRRALAREARGGAIVHGHGLWLLPNLYPAVMKQRFGCRFVQSTRGMLSPVALRISRWKKRPAWWMAQRWCLAAADCLHATAPSELEEIRRAGLRNPVAVIPNGIDVPAPAARCKTRNDTRTVLYLGRLHPKKAVDRLLRAWAVLGDAREGWRLCIAGPAEGGYDAQLRALAGSLGAHDLAFLPAAYGPAKADLLANADLFCLPTLNENFGIAVAEALAFGVPVITTTGAPWQGLEREGCGWWVSPDIAPLVAALTAAMDMQPEDLRAMGVRGQAWMQRDFSWGPIAADMACVYRWLQNGGSPPACVDIVRTSTR